MTFLGRAGVVLGAFLDNASDVRSVVGISSLRFEFVERSQAISRLLRLLHTSISHPAFDGWSCAIVFLIIHISDDGYAHN